MSPLTASRSLKAFSPRISVREGLIGRISPAKPCLRRKRWGREVVLLASAEAPISAMRRGSNSEANSLSGWLMARVYSAHDPSPHIHRRLAGGRPAGTGTSLAEQAHQARRALRARRHDRRHRPHGGRISRPAARPEHHRRQQAGQGRDGRHRPGRQGAARRLHAPDVGDLGLVDLAYALWRRRLRPDGRLHPYLDRLAQPQRPGGQPELQGPDVQGVHRDRQGRARQARLCDLGCGLEQSSAGRAARAGDRRGDGPYPLSRRRACHGRHHRGQRPVDVRFAAVGRYAHQGRQGARARRQRRGTQSRLSRRADDEGVGLSRPDLLFLVRHLGAGQDAAADRRSIGDRNAGRAQGAGGRETLGGDRRGVRAPRRRPRSHASSRPRSTSGCRW